MTAPEIELRQAPSDGISAVRFGPAPDNHLLVSSWDKTLRVYDVAANILRTRMELPGPVLCCAFANANTAYSGNLNKSVYAHDLATGSSSVLGQHEDGIRGVEFSEKHGLVITGSWDKTIMLWDPRQRAAVGSYAHPDKVLALSAVDDTVVVGTGGRHVWIWDLRHMEAVQQRRESSLKFQTRSIRCMPDGRGYVLASIEGRVAVEWFDPSPEGQKNKFAFKCHRLKVDGKDYIYPVNAVAFHPIYGTFATGGCDGVVNTWDGLAKKRVCQFRRYPTSISALDFNHDGSQLAIASSYTFEEGEKDHPPDAIFIHSCADTEVKPKSA